jgi:hypothetical protein
VPFSSAANQPSYWENLGYGTCEKDDSPSTPWTLPTAPVGFTWTLVVVKAGAGNDANGMFPNPTVGQSYQNCNAKDNSHVIYCKKPSGSSSPSSSVTSRTTSRSTVTASRLTSTSASIVTTRSSSATSRTTSRTSAVTSAAACSSVPFSATANQPSYWEALGYGTCFKDDNPSTPWKLPSAPAGKQWTLVVAKAGAAEDANGLFPNPSVGQLYQNCNGKDNSHMIYCYK